MSKQKRCVNPDDREKPFIEKAREIGADEEHSKSDELIEQLAKKLPKPRKRSKPLSHSSSEGH